MTGSVVVLGLKVAAFGPFGEFAINPASALASSVFKTVDLLEVSFEAVDTWLASIREQDWNRLIVFGVAARISAIQLETKAKNHIGETPDVTGHVRGSEAISPTGPSHLASTLWEERPFQVPDSPWDLSTDAGSYLCNYLLYRALTEFPERAVGFVHIPPFDTVPLREQQQVVERLVKALAT